jgi:PAS domain S-box-containing protein
MSAAPVLWTAITLQQSADALIALGTGALGGALLYLVRARPTLLHRRVFGLFGLVLGGAAAAHAAMLFAGGEAAQAVALGLKLATGGCAVAAAVALARVLPSVLVLPGRAELQRLTYTLEERVAARTADLTAANEQLRREIAQREQAEAEVRRLNAELQARLAETRSLFRLLPVGVAIASDVHCRELRWNDAFAAMFGLPREVPASLSASPLAPASPFRLRREGRELAREELPMHRALAENAPVTDFEATLVRPDGQTLEVLANAVPIRDEAGAPTGCVATFQNLTAPKQAERQRLDFERRLLQAQKLESIGVLAGGIAHDFNNLLTGVLGHANFARSELARGITDIDALLAQVEISAKRAADLCGQLLAYAGKGRFVVRLIDPNVAVEQAVPLLRLSMTKKATLALELGAGLPPFRGDPAQINQALINLVANAAESITAPAGVVTLRTQRVQLAPMDLLTLHAPPEIEPGAFVCIAVADTGGGIAPEAIGHIFEPFFTTKFIGRGLGLSAVLGIVHGHRGAVRVTSQVGAGTTFELFFPVAAAARATGLDLPAPAPRARSAVLVVDDDETVRGFASTALRTAGYQVATAADGEEALALLRRDPMGFEAVLLDLTMPKLDGEDTLLALRMLAPSLPVVLTSGYSEQAVAQRFVGRGVASFVAKPFVRDAVIAAIREAIERTRATAPSP